MSIDVGNIEWKYMTNPIYIGDRKTDEIWVGNRKIYPELQKITGTLRFVVIYDGDVYGLYRTNTIFYSYLIVKREFYNDKYIWVKVLDTQCRFIRYMITYNDGIHLFMDDSNSGADYVKNHYVFKNNKLVKLSNLPDVFTAGSCVVYDNKLYCLGIGEWHQSMYAFDGTAWQRCSIKYKDYVSFYYVFITSAPVVYNDQLYDIEFNWGVTMTVWNNPEWVSVCDPPKYTGEYHRAHGGFPIVYNGYINFFITAEYGYDSEYNSQHLISNGDGWSIVDSQPPVDIGYGYYCVINNILHVFTSGLTSTTSDCIKHYTYDGNVWTRLSDEDVYV